MEEVTHEAFERSPEPPRALAAGVPGLHGELGVAVGELSQPVPATVQAHAATDCELLLGDFELVELVFDDAGGALEQVAAFVEADGFATDARFLALGADRNGQEQSQEPGGTLFDLFVVDQALPGSLRRGGNAHCRDHGQRLHHARIGFTQALGSEGIRLPWHAPALIALATPVGRGRWRCRAANLPRLKLTQLLGRRPDTT